MGLFDPWVGKVHYLGSGIRQSPPWRVVWGTSLCVFSLIQFEIRVLISKYTQKKDDLEELRRVPLKPARAPPGSWRICRMLEKLASSGPSTQLSLD